MSTPMTGFDTERAQTAAIRMRYQEIREQLEQLRVRVDSADRNVTVEMGPGGAVLALHFTDAAMAMSPQALATTVIEAINHGMVQVADRTTEVVGPFVSSAGIDLRAVTSGSLPPLPSRRSVNPFAAEIEQASAIPKGPLGQYARQHLSAPDPAKARAQTLTQAPAVRDYQSGEHDG